jgi:hypothetical protein
MKEQLIYTVIFHHDNGTSFLCGVFDEVSGLTKYVSNEGFSGMEAIKLTKKLKEKSYGTLHTLFGQYSIVSCKANEKVNVNIN